MMVYNKKEKHITISDINCGKRRANRGDWVCINSSGTIFPLGESEFHKEFELDA